MDDRCCINMKLLGRKYSNDYYFVRDYKQTLTLDPYSEEIKRPL